MGDEEEIFIIGILGGKRIFLNKKSKHLHGFLAFPREDSENSVEMFRNWGGGKT